MVKVPEIISANEQLMPKTGVTKTGKRYSYMFMPPQVKKYKKDLIEEFEFEQNEFPMTEDLS